MKKEIIPAIMPERFEDIEMMAGLVKNEVATVQIDIMDGAYVPEKTWPYVDTRDMSLQQLLSEENSLPFWQELNYELDLMIERPEEQLDTWLNLGASRVVFHYTSVHSWEKIRNIDSVLRNFVSIGCAITIHDDLEKVFPLIEDGTVNFVQVMGIAHIGYQGEPFEEEALHVIAQLHARYPDLLITVDGGVSEETITHLAEKGASCFVSGSAVFGGGVASENIDFLNSLVAKK